VKVGDLLYLHPDVGVPIELVELGHGFVMHELLNTKTGESLAGRASLPADFVNMSWLFYVYDIEGGCSRFISRWRVDYPPSLKNEIMNGRYGLEPIATVTLAVQRVMDFKMLKGVKQRAEHAQSV
jgi:hypothetical protein